MVEIHSSVAIIGASRTECIVIGGFAFTEKKVHVIIKTMTIRDSLTFRS